jgi:hypothetical protein
MKEDKFPQVALELELNEDIEFSVFLSIVKVAISVTSRIKSSLLSFFLLDIRRLPTECMSDMAI